MLCMCELTRGFKAELFSLSSLRKVVVNRQ